MRKAFLLITYHLELFRSLSFIASIFFLDSSSLSAEITQVVKLRTANSAEPYNVDMINNGRVQRKDTLDANAETDLSDSDRFTRSTVFAGDHYALKNLKTFFVAFLDADVDLNGIARLKRRDIFPQLCCFY